ncbi:phosphorylase [Alkalinema sp. FACHB-956]|uniref:phosphorylase family protein n=1 Tax=Alkalinema sp. FACHB-956 TaxID=2692768 RepID=UPI001688E63B|nr:phosphorylase [Alkalinema sp. FACHB-956]
MSVPTILVPRGAEYQAVCRGLQSQGPLDRSPQTVSPDLPQVLAIPAGLSPVKRWLEEFAANTSPLPSAILVMGVCGALRDRGNQDTIGSAVVYQSCLDPTGQSWHCANLTQIGIASAIVNPLALPASTGITCDRVIHLAQEKQQLAQQLQADVVDMENTAILEFFSQHNIPVAIVRVISDDAHHDLPDLSQGFDENGQLRPITLALAMLRRPIAAVRLIRGSLTALKILERLSGELIQSPCSSQD